MYDKPFKKPDDEVGLLWNKEGKNGPYMSGFVDIDGTQVNIVVFATNAQGERAPAWSIRKAKPKSSVPF